MEQDLELDLCPRCRGCTNFKCLHNGPVMVKFKAIELEGMPLNKCNTQLGYKTKLREKFLKILTKEFQERIKKLEEYIMDS